jgi:CBS domain-containing protein
MRVQDVMTKTVLSTTPGTPLRDAALTLAREGISGMPVVDGDGALVGVFSEADVIAKEGVEPARRGVLGWLVEPADTWLEDRLAATTVGDAMSSPPVTIAPDRPVSEAAMLMLDEGVNRLPVVEDGALVGLVSRADLVRAFVRTDAEIRAEIQQEAIRKALWLDPNDVRVTVDGGHVKLAGSVASDSDAELLLTFTRRVPGVVAVTSEVTARS